MFAQVKGAINRGLGLNFPGLEFVVFPDDVILVSFPKSGSTWMRFLLVNLIYPELGADFKKIRVLIPDPHGVAKRDIARLKRPRIIKTHHSFDPRYPRVIYMVRDPRDVALSSYHFNLKFGRIGDELSIEQFVDRFVSHERRGPGSWGENVATWLVTRRNDPGFLLVRYEDMIADTARELARAAKFLGISATPQQIAEAVEKSSAKKMREIEKTQSDVPGLTRGKRKDIPFVRSAKSGNWKSDLPATSVAKIEAAWGATMRYLGYELASPPASKAEANSPGILLESLLR